MQADAYLLEVEQAIGDGNYDRAWDRLQDIVRLQTDNDFETPEFHFWYAKAADVMNMSEQALESVTEYLTAAGRDAVHYAEALALLTALQAAVGCQGWNADAYFETATPEQVTACLETRTVDLDAQNASGLTPLQAAAIHAQDPAVIQALLDAGAQVEAADAVSGATPLSLAIRENGVPAIIEVLLAGGSNPDTPDNAGLTPLHLAALHTDDPVVYEILLTARSGLTTPEQVLEVAERSVEILIENGATRVHLKQALDSIVRDLKVAGLDAANLQALVRCTGWHTDGYFETATLEQVTACLETGVVDLNAFNASGITPLHSAAANGGNPAVVAALLAAGADHEARTEDGNTLIQLAARNENVAVIFETVLAAGGYLNVRNNDGSTPLHQAATYNGNPEAIEFLLAAGADVDVVDENGRTPLHLAARLNDNPSVIETLLAAGADPMARDNAGWTVLHRATWSNENPAVINALRAAGAEQTQRQTAGLDCNDWNEEFFEDARVEHVLACLDAGADPMARDQYESGPLHWAAEHVSDSAVIEVLLAAGEDVNVNGYYGNDRLYVMNLTPLHLAGSNVNPHVAKILLAAGADVHARDSAGRTPLHWAAGATYSDHDGGDRERNPAVIELLLAAGADVNAQSRRGDTPLHWAADTNKDRDALELLIAAGANLMLQNEDGDSPWDVARRGYKDFLGNAFGGLPAEEKDAMLAAAGRGRRRTTSQPSDGVGRGIAALFGGAAIAVAGAQSGANTEDIADAIGQFAEGTLTGQAVGNTGVGFDPSLAPANQGGLSDEANDALRNLEASCGETFRSGFAEYDHLRFHCLDAFGRHCALKQGHNEQHLEALRRDYEVLRGIGAASKCPYFEVFGVSYSGDWSAPPADPAAAETGSAQEPEDNEENKPTPKCPDGGGIPINVMNGKKTGCTPAMWCRYSAV